MTNNTQNLQNTHRWQRYYTMLDPLVRKPKVQAYSFLVLSLFTSAFFLFFAVRPTINTIINLRKQIEDSTNVNSKLTEKINALAQIQAQYEVIKPDLPLLAQAMPERADVVGLVQQIEKITTDNQAALTAMQFSEANLVGEGTGKDTQNSIPVTFQVSAGGDYSRLLALLNSISKLPRLVSVDSLNINSGTASPAATIRLKAYYYIKDK